MNISKENDGMAMVAKSVVTLAKNVKALEQRIKEMEKTTSNITHHASDNDGTSANPKSRDFLRAYKYVATVIKALRLLPELNEFRQEADADAVGVAVAGCNGSLGTDSSSCKSNSNDKAARLLRSIAFTLSDLETVASHVSQFDEEVSLSVNTRTEEASTLSRPANYVQMKREDHQGLGLGEVSNICISTSELDCGNGNDRLHSKTNEKENTNETLKDLLHSKDEKLLKLLEESRQQTELIARRTTRWFQGQIILVILALILFTGNIEDNAVFLPGSIDTGFSFGRKTMNTTFDGSTEDTGEGDIILSNAVEDSHATDKFLASLPVHDSPPEEDDSLSSEKLDPDNNKEAAIITSHGIADEKNETLHHFEKSAVANAEIIDHKTSEMKCAHPYSSENNPNEDNDLSTDEEIICILDDDDDDDDDANLEIENAGIVASNEAIISQDDMNMDKDSETIIGNGHNPLHQDNVEERTDITPLDSSRGWIETSLCVELSDMMDCTHSKKKKDRHSNSSISGYTTAGDLILPVGLDLKTFRRSMIKRQIFTAIGVAIIMAMPQIIPQMLAFKLKSILSIPFWRSLMEFLTVAMQ